MNKKIENLLKKKAIINIDLGGGENPQKNFINVDIRPLKTVDIVHDLETFPWPLPDNSVHIAMASHLVEHINPAKGTFIRFMDEVWRTLKPGGQFLIATPYAGSTGYFQDPTHVNPCNEITWTYFDPEHQGRLYEIYKPKPWKILVNTWHVNGNMEIVLEKRKKQ